MLPDILQELVPETSTLKDRLVVSTYYDIYIISYFSSIVKY